MVLAGGARHLHSRLDRMHGEAREWIRVVAFVVVLVDVLVQPWEVEHAVGPVEMGVAVGVESYDDKQHLPRRYL